MFPSLGEDGGSIPPCHQKYLTKECMNNLIELIQEEKWIEIPEFPRFDHNACMDRIIEAVKEAEKKYILMKEKLDLAELDLKDYIKEEKQLKWLNQFKDDDENGY
jgi:hypothetical protein